MELNEVPEHRSATLKEYIQPNLFQQQFKIVS